MFRLFRARHTAFDPEQEAALRIRKAKGNEPLASIKVVITSE